MPDPFTIFSSWPQYLAVSAVMVVAQTVYVSFGFGAGLIAVGSLALVFPEIRDAVVLLLLVNIPAELYVVISSRQHISWRGILLIVFGILLGTPAGTLALRFGDPTFLLVLLGGFLVVTGLCFPALPENCSVKWKKGISPLVGLSSGILAGLFGTGGPPLILYYHLGGVKKAAFRGNLMAIFLLITLVRVPSYAIGGLISPPRIWSSLAILPAVGLGVWLGSRIHLRLSETAFRRLASIVLALIGVALLLRS